MTKTLTSDGVPTGRGFGWRAALCVALGLPGVLSTLLVAPSVPGVPAVALLANPTILLVIAALVGCAAAWRVGLRSRILDRRGAGLIRSGDLAIVMAAVVLGAAVALGEHALQSGWQNGSAVPSLVDGWSPAGLVVGLLYGGVAEEIIMRYGLLAGLAWALSFVLPQQVSLWIAAVASAAAFAAGHLPVLVLAGAELDAPMLLRTLGLNLAFGLVFALAFIRRDLESAMLLHGGCHIGFAVAAIAAGAAG